MYKWIGEKLNIKTHASVRSYKSAEHADTSLNICWIFPVFEEKKRACKTSSQPALRWDRLAVARLNSVLVIYVFLS